MSSKINLNDIERIIPDDYDIVPNEDKRKTLTEWCVKKYQMNERTYVTISIHFPNSNNVVYVNSSGEHIVYNIDDKYEKYVVECKYWYAQ